MKTWKIHFKAGKQIHKFSPGLLSMVLFSALLDAIQPFVILQVTSEMIQRIVEQKVGSEIIQTIVWYAVILLLLQMGREVLKRIKKSAVMKLQLKTEGMLLECCHNMEYQRLESQEVQGLLAFIKQSKFQRGDIFEKEVDSLEALMRSLLGLVFSLVYTIGLFQLLLGKVATRQTILLSPYLFFLFLVALLVLVVITACYGKKHNEGIQKRFTEVMPINRLFGFYRREVFQNYPYGKEIRIYQEEELIQHEFEKTLDITGSFMEQIGKQEGRYRGRNALAVNLLSIVLYTLLALYAYSGFLNVGALVRYIGVIGELIKEVSASVVAVVSLAANNMFLEKYMEFLQLGFSQKETKCKDVSQKVNKIVFQDVVFGYTKEEKPVLNGVSFEIKGGEHIGLVGLNGSGKTTCIRLLCRLYRPDKGHILLNDRDIWEYPLEEYRSLLGVVFQDYHLFSFPMEQNISGKEKIETQKMKDALETVGVWECVARNIQKIRKRLET